MINFDYLFRILARVVVLLTCIPIHECAHGYVAYRLGDRTARDQRRLTLNPLRHFDFLGTISLVLLGFGWAKPVPVDPRNFRGNMKRGMALTALAGPVANLLMAFALLIVYKLALFALLLSGAVDSALASGVLSILSTMVLTNISLCVFNLLPINPLDGSRILGLLLPDRVYYFLMRYERYIFLILLVLLVTNVLDRPIGLLSHYLLTGLNFLTSFIDIFARLILG